MDYGFIYFDRSILRNALARRLDPATPAADAITQGQVAQIKLGNGVPFGFKLNFQLVEIGIKRS